MILQSSFNFPSNQIGPTDYSRFSVSWFNNWDDEDICTLKSNGNIWAGFDLLETEFAVTFLADNRMRILKQGRRE